MFLFICMIIIWVFLTGEVTLSNIGFASILSLFLLFVSNHRMELRHFIPRRKGFNIFKYIIVLIKFAGFFLAQLLQAGFSVFLAVFNPQALHPGVIAVPLDVETDAEITLLANLITLTPGTLALDVSSDKRVMYVHTIEFKDKASFVQGIKNGFEKRVLEVMRP